MITEMSGKRKTTKTTASRRGTIRRKRKYTLKARAERRDATRNRIVEATMALHQELGPRDTTISAIAERAGVQRLTVYRHFQDENSLFTACSTRYLERNPPPDPGLWQGFDNPGSRTRAALEAVYTYYRGTQDMWTSIYRDLEDMPVVQEHMVGFDTYLDRVRRDLVAAWNTANSPGSAANARVVLAHALQFGTWKSLAGEGLDDAAMAGLVTRWVTAARSDSG